MIGRAPGYRLFVDIQTIQNAFHPPDRGIPRYASEFGRALARRRPETRLALSPFHPWPHSLHPELAAAPQLVLNTPRELRAAVTEGPVAYLVMSPFELSPPVQAVMPPHVAESGVPIVSVLYDLIPEVLGVYDAVAPAVSATYRRRRESVRRYDLFLALSKHTRRDAIERLGLAPERVLVVGAGASGYFHSRSRHDPLQTAASKLPAINRRFVLTVTGYVPHKNTEILIDAWARLPRAFRATHQLVITCGIPASGPTVWTERARALGIDREEIVYTGHVADPLLRSLYQAADLFVLPSLYEGFGLPVLEAVRCGTPAITSDASSLPEVLDYPPATFPPHDADVLAALVERVADDDGFRHELEAAGERAVARHTWEHVVDRSLDALALLPAPNRARRAPRLRIALVGPFPPSPGEVALANATIAEELAAHASVDCFSEPADGSLPRVPRGYHRFPASALGTTFDPAAYDAVIYTMGDSRHHVETYRLACTFPGIVWFHDTSLAELQIARASKRPDGESAWHFMVDFLVRLGYLPPMGPGRDDLVLDVDAYRNAEILLSRELVAAARGCIVGSPQASTALEIDAGASVVMPPMWVVPNAAEQATASVVARQLATIVRELSAEPAPTTRSPQQVPA